MPPAGRSRSEVRGLTGEGFERHLADLLRARGWRAELTQRSRDGGIDLRLHKSDEIGIESAFYVQCKNQRTAVPVEVVRELNGVLDANVRGIVASPSGFTGDAQAFAKERGIVLWGPAELDELARPEAEA
jgi:HJR/Mrr/RecB family endonuclease